ncbi:hypothetical protein CLCHR_14380 [Clostridium chromiireducens]|uniref:Uncharacterized protein n=1 Tax=Clostridium chromiireducens TaxID=225345 RepID=A0A1V4IVJ1_9CLOT|nr:hypothetical protein CLCHR_14380 [Clostridium chromiireducens]
MKIIINWERANEILINQNGRLITKTAKNKRNIKNR